MKDLQYAQDLIKTNDPAVRAGFNMFIMGYDSPQPRDYYDCGERIQGYNYAKEMAMDGKITFTHKFRCSCGGYPFQYGGFWVCNDCGGKDVDKHWWKIKVEKDGNEFCCYGIGFINLQESDNYAFGETFDIAIKNYGKLMANCN